MWAKIFLPFVGLLWGASLPLTSSQAETVMRIVSVSAPEDVMVEWVVLGRSGVLSPLNDSGDTTGIITVRINGAIISAIEVAWQLGAILVCTFSGSVPEGMMIMAGGQSGNTSGTISARIGNTAFTSVQVRFFEDDNKYVCQFFPGSQTKVNEPEETSLQPAQTILTGMVIGLNASEVSIQWVKNALIEGHHVNTRVLKDSIKVSLLAISQVIVPYSDWKNGTSYSCRFTLEADTMKLSQRPEEKSQREK